jgi:hypothetical protein
MIAVAATRIDLFTIDPLFAALTVHGPAECGEELNEIRHDVGLLPQDDREAQERRLVVPARRGALVGQMDWSDETVGPPQLAPIAKIRCRPRAATTIARTFCTGEGPEPGDSTEPGAFSA